MAKGTQMAIQGAGWGLLALDFIGWVLLLSGVSAMQDACGGSDANLVLGGGSAGFNAPEPCDTFFAYTWWMTFYNLFVLILAAVTLSGFLSKFRPGIIALLAINIMQSMDIANTYLYYDTIFTNSGTFEARAKVTAAGAIIKAISLLLLVGVLGVRNESSDYFEKSPRGGASKTTTTQVGKAPVGPPASTNVLQPEPETVGVRPGRIGEAGPL